MDVFFSNMTVTELEALQAWAAPSTGKEVPNDDIAEKENINTSWEDKLDASDKGYADQKRGLIKLRSKTWIAPAAGMGEVGGLGNPEDRMPSDFQINWANALEPADDFCAEGQHRSFVQDLIDQRSEEYVPDDQDKLLKLQLEVEELLDKADKDKVEFHQTLDQFSEVTRERDSLLNQLRERDVLLDQIQKEKQQLLQRIAMQDEQMTVQQDKLSVTMSPSEQQKTPKQATPAKASSKVVSAGSPAPTYITAPSSSPTLSQKSSLSSPPQTSAARPVTMLPPVAAAKYRVSKDATGSSNFAVPATSPTGLNVSSLPAQSVIVQRASLPGGSLSIGQRLPASNGSVLLAAAQPQRLQLEQGMAVSVS